MWWKDSSFYLVERFCYLPCLSTCLTNCLFYFHLFCFHVLFVLGIGLLNAILVHNRFGAFILILRKKSDNNSMCNYVRVYVYLC